MKYVRTITPAILVLMLALCCMAAETDARLDQEVDIKALAQPLGSFVTPLGMQTGIVIKADKSVADLKVTVLAKKLPVSQLLSAIAEALHIQLRSSTSDTGMLTYEFYQDAASKKKADDLYNQSRTGLHRQMDHAADILRLNLSDEELQKKIESDEMAKPYIGEPSFRMAVEVYANLPAKDRDRLWDIGMLPVDLAKIPKATRDKVVAVFDENRKQREQADNIKLTDTAASVLFEVQDDPLAGRSLSFNIVGTGTHGMTYMFMELEEGSPDLLGNGDLFTLRVNDKTSEFYTEAGQLPEKLAADAGVELSESTLIQAIEMLHEKTGVSIIADHYTPRYSAQAMIDKWAITKGDTIAHEIEKITEVYMGKWKLTGDACVIWSRTWFEDRNVELPLSTIQRWNSARQKTMRFELPELMEMALMGEKQQKTIRYYGITIPDSFFPCMRALRFCSTLLPAERGQAATDQGLQADKLADDQKLALTHWLLSPTGMDRKPSTLTEESIKGAQIRIFQRDSEWVFRVQTSNGQAREDILKLS